MTLRHIVSWKLTGATLEERNIQANQARAALEPLSDLITEIKALNLYRNELFDGANFDLTLIVDFDNADALATYAAHPDHQPAIVLMKEITSARVATDFTV